jgi:hypothetical protein
MRPSSENVFLLNVGRLEVARLELRDRGFDRRLALGRVQSLPFRRGEDEVEDGALLGGELRLDEIGCPLGVRPRDLELVLQAAAEREDENDEHGEDAAPGADDTPRMGGAGAHPAREPSGRQAFVGQASLAVALGGGGVAHWALLVWSLASRH